LKIRLLPSSFEEDGSPSARQHLACLIINDRVAVDAGSLAMAATDDIRRSVRDIVLTHAHLDHIAGLPLFIDDLFATLDEPVRVHALQDVIEVLERDIFNWSVFPKFSEIDAAFGPPIVYRPISFGCEFQAANLSFRAFGSDHKVPSAGYIVSDGKSSVAISGDSASLEQLTIAAENQKDLTAVLVECAFPDEFETIARNSHHMTPAILGEQLKKLDDRCPVFVINIKPNYRQQVVEQISALQIKGIEIMNVGEDYFW